MEIYLIGALIGVLGLFWAILSLQDDPLEEGIRQAQAWEAQQAKMRKALDR